MQSRALSSWEHEGTVYTASKTIIQMQGTPEPLIILGRYFPYQEDSEAFCKTCQSQKVYGDLLIAMRDSSPGANRIRKAFLPLEFCAGTFIRVQENISSCVQDLLLGKSHPPMFPTSSMDPVLTTLGDNSHARVYDDIIRAFVQDIPTRIDRRPLFCGETCELAPNLYQALGRSVTERGSQGYYAQKGLSELFSLINKHYPAFGVFWPSEVGAIGTATIKETEILINLQLKSIRYSHRQ